MKPQLRVVDAEDRLRVKGPLNVGGTTALLDRQLDAHEVAGELLEDRPLGLGATAGVTLVLPGLRVFGDRWSLAHRLLVLLDLAHLVSNRALAPIDHGSV